MRSEVRAAGNKRAEGCNAGAGYLRTATSRTGLQGRSATLSTSRKSKSVKVPSQTYLLVAVETEEDEEED